MGCYIVFILYQPNSILFAILGLERRSVGDAAVQHRLNIPTQEKALILNGSTAATAEVAVAGGCRSKISP